MVNINPAQMKAMMKQMGISQEEINALRVIIEKEDENIIIENPDIAKVKMGGNVSWQISGDERIESKEMFSDEDVRLVMEKSGCSESKAKQALEKTHGDIAEAIMELS